MIYLNFSYHLKPIQSHPQQKKNINHSQDNLEFTFTRMQLLLHIKHQNHKSNLSFTSILTKNIYSWCCCLFRESSTWRSCTKISRPCDFLSPWWRGNPPTISHQISSSKMFFLLNDETGGKNNLAVKYII